MLAIKAKKLKSLKKDCFYDSILHASLALSYLWHCIATFSSLSGPAIFYKAKRA